MRKRIARSFDIVIKIPIYKIKYKIKSFFFLLFKGHYQVNVNVPFKVTMK